MAMVDKSKTPEELALEWWAEYSKDKDLNKWNTVDPTVGFVAGYQAAQEHAHAALEEAEVRIQELRDQLMEESGGRLRLFKDEADAKAALLEALQKAEGRMEEIKYLVANADKVMPDTCEHILDMSKMVDVNGWISVNKDEVVIDGKRYKLVE